MKRRNFFKKLGIGVTALVVAPKILAEVIKDDIYDDNTEWMPDGSHVTLEKVGEDDWRVLEKHPLTPNECYLKGVINKDGVISFEAKHYFKINDVIMLDNQFIKRQCIVIDIFHNNSIIVRSLDSRWIEAGEIDVYYISREFSKGTGV